MSDDDSFNDQMILKFHLKIFSSKFLKKTNLQYKMTLTFKQRNSQNNVYNYLFFHTTPSQHFLLRLFCCHKTLKPGCDVINKIYYNSLYRHPPSCTVVPPRRLQGKLIPHASTNPFLKNNKIIILRKL